MSIFGRAVCKPQLATVIPVKGWWEIHGDHSPQVWYIVTGLGVNQGCAVYIHRPGGFFRFQGVQRILFVHQLCFQNEAVVENLTCLSCLEVLDLSRNVIVWETRW